MVGSAQASYGGGVVVILIYLVAIFADFLAPFRPISIRLDILCATSEVAHGLHRGWHQVPAVIWFATGESGGSS